MHLPEPSAGASGPQPGWYPDPWQVAPTRWWDGMTWTGFTTPTAVPVAARITTNLRTNLPTNLPTNRPDAIGDESHDGGFVITIGFLSALVLSAFFSTLASALGAPPSTVPNFVAGVGGLWLGLCTTAYVVSHRRPGGTLADLGFQVPTGNEIGIGIGIGLIAYMTAGRVSLVLLHLFPTGGGTHALVTSTPSHALVYVFALTACIGAPIVEELFFRGALQSLLTRSLGTSPAIVIQAMLFGFAHFETSMTFNQAAVRCGTVMVLGLFNGWLRDHTGRLGAGMVAHATYNFIVTLFLLHSIGLG